MKLFSLIIFALILIAFARSKSNHFEGDIDLRGKPIQAYVKKFERGNTIVYGSYSQRNAIKGEVYRWTNGVIPYEISNDFGSRQRKIIQAAIDEFHKKTCIKWMQKSSKDNDYVSIEYSKDGCLSPIGKQGGPQFLDIDNGCLTKGIIIHEMMHALGFFHEQSRTDRDEYVEIIWDNIDTVYAERNFDKFGMGIEDLGYPYDYGSIMHYGSSDFSKDSMSTTIRPFDRSAKIGQRLELSITDAKKVNKLYKCSNFDISGAKEGGSSNGDSRGPVESRDVCVEKFQETTILTGANPVITTLDFDADCVSKCLSSTPKCHAVVFDHQKKMCSQYFIPFTDSQLISGLGSVTTLLKPDSECPKQNESRDVCVGKFVESKIFSGAYPVISTLDSDADCVTKCISSMQSCYAVVFNHQENMCSEYFIPFDDNQLTPGLASVTTLFKPDSECPQKNGNANCADTITVTITSKNIHNIRQEQCDIWANAGYCFTRRENIMQKYCPKTCMYCGSCENIYENKYCQFYKDSGFCSKFEHIMSYRCMKTCNKCFI